jgi:hypothetical protein
MLQNPDSITSFNRVMLFLVAGEIFRYLLAIGGQTRTAKKVLTHALPTAVVDEELLQPREPVAVANREIAGLKLVAQLE